MPNNIDSNQEVGYVTSSRNFLVHLNGLPSARINDMVVNEQGIRGWVNAVFNDSVEILILDQGNVTPGQLFKKLNTQLTVNVGEFLTSRAINPLGVPIDGKGPLPSPTKASLDELDKTATGIYSRQFIDQQFVTGIALIDTLIPIGKGQRELVLGDAHSGKTSFLIDLIINQKNSGVVCIYAAIGQSITRVRTLIDLLHSNGAIDHTIVVASSSSEPAPMIFLTPQTAFTIAEFFCKKGRDVLLILDDLGIHSKIYREISLIGGKAPGRESYPGDIFYQHSHLIERAGRFNRQFGGGSITAIPVIEINLGDFTTLIPTNVMSMTDGHLLFKASLHNQGQRPAIDISLSVSRVGRQTQNRIHNSLSSKIRQILAEADQLETVSRFSSELPEETQILLRQKEIVLELIRQDSLTYIPIEVQIMLFGLIFTKFFKDKGGTFIKEYKALLIYNFIHDPTLNQVTKAALQYKSEQDLVKMLDQLGPTLAKLCTDENNKKLK